MFGRSRTSCDLRPRCPLTDEPAETDQPVNSSKQTSCRGRTVMLFNHLHSSQERRVLTRAHMWFHSSLPVRPRRSDCCRRLLLSAAWLQPPWNSGRRFSAAIILIALLHSVKSFMRPVSDHTGGLVSSFRNLPHPTESLYVFIDILHVAHVYWLIPRTRRRRCCLCSRDRRRTCPDLQQKHTFTAPVD